MEATTDRAQSAEGTAVHDRAEGLEMIKQKCPECHNEFAQPLVLLCVRDDSPSIRWRLIAKDEGS
jgi:hypothetical protein